MKLSGIRFSRNREKNLLSLCRNKTILHFGCADEYNFERKLAEGTFLHNMLVEVASEVLGIDANASVLARLRNEHGLTNLMVGDAERLDAVGLEKRFDVVLAGELIEHLSNPGLFLEGTKRFMDVNSLLILTTPNALSLKLFIHGLWKEEISSPYHTMLFTPSTISALLARHNFVIVEIIATTQTGYRSTRNSLANAIFYPLLNFFPHFAEDLIIVARMNH